MQQPWSWLNLTRLTETHVQQITEDKWTNFSHLTPDPATLFNLLLTGKDFNVDGTPELNKFTAKLTKNRYPMGSINMVWQETRLWGGSISNKSLLQLLSSGYTLLVSQTKSLTG